MRRIAAIAQARMGSSRLPGKILKELKGKTVLFHFIDRVKYAKLLDDIIIATTTSEKDKEIINFAIRNKINWYAGSVDDVLDRYYQAAKKFEATDIVRLTSDCPVIDPEVIDLAVQLYLDNDFDYVSNTNPPTYPDGLDVEIFSMKALEKAWKEAKMKSQREHVTPYISKNPDKFKMGNISYKENISYFRLTLDYREDYDVIVNIYDALYNEKRIFLLDDILSYLKDNPQVLQKNAKYSRNEGYIKSLIEDEEVR